MRLISVWEIAWPWQTTQAAPSVTTAVTTGAGGAAERRGHALKSRGEKTKAILGLTWVSLYLVQPLPQYGNTGDIRLPWLHQKRSKKLSIKEGFVAWMCNRPHFFFPCRSLMWWWASMRFGHWLVHVNTEPLVAPKGEQEIPTLFTFAGIRSFLKCPKLSILACPFSRTSLEPCSSLPLGRWLADSTAPLTTSVVLQNLCRGTDDTAPSRFSGTLCTEV